MKLIRHILSHTILIGFVALLVLGFYYRAALFPASWNEQISQQVVRVAGPYASKMHAFAAPVIENTTQTVAEAPSPQPVSEPTPAVVSEATPADVPQVEESAANEVVETVPAAESVVAESADNTPAAAAPAEETQAAPVVAEVPVPAAPVKPPVEETAKARPSTDEKVAVAEAAAEPVIEKPAPGTAASAPDHEENKSAAPVVAQAPASVAPVTPPTQEAAPANVVADEDEVVATGSSDRDFVGIDDLWLQARAAYGRGDLASATQHYLALSEQESDNPDVYGELGNVYYARGNFPEAGEAYYEAAIRLMELGQMGQMQYLVRVIEGLSPDSAAKLKQRLMR